MLDCGFGVREAVQRLERRGLAPQDLSALIVTHEHKDHVGGVFKLARRFDIPVWLSHGTYQALRPDTTDGVTIHFCRDGETFSIGDLSLSPYTVPHDAREPVQYVASNGAARLGVLTDAGHATAHIVAALSKCNALMLECNHDRQMLADSAYPVSLKRRIGGAFGHLSNEAGAQILAAIDRSRLHTVVAAHLSRQNNTPALARAALAGALGAQPIDLRIACQDDGFDWIEIA